MDIDTIELQPVQSDFIDITKLAKPAIGNSENYTIVKSKFPMFAKYKNLKDEHKLLKHVQSVAHEDTLLICCPNCSIPMKIKQSVLSCINNCPINFNLTISWYMAEIQAGKTFFKEENLEKQHFYFPYCGSCKQITFGATQNSTYSTHCQAYFICKCSKDSANRIVMTIPFDKSTLNPNTCSYKLYDNMLNEAFYSKLQKKVEATSNKYKKNGDSGAASANLLPAAMLDISDQI